MEYKEEFLEYFNIKTILVKEKTSKINIIVMAIMCLGCLIIRIFNIMPMVPISVLIGMTFYTGLKIILEVIK